MSWGYLKSHRVELAHEATDNYDPAYYETQLVRAVESVLSPLGWNQTDIEAELSDTELETLFGFAA